jgi:hypothetical protein
MSPSASELAALVERAGVLATAKAAVARVGLRANQRYTGWRGRRGTPLVERDWDNCLILDACRYDMCVQSPRLDDARLSAVRSLGSSSAEFIRQNFAGRRLHDTVYVTANPHVTVLADDVFHDVWHLYEDCWDDAAATVTPETVADETRRAAEEYPNKRLLIHFMQPHYPFLGPTGSAIDQKGILQGTVGSGTEGLARYAIWTQLQFGIADVSLDELWQAYRENLDIVLDEALPLAESLPGKSVLTADHGNVVTERLRPIPVRWYGHPPRVDAAALTTVPWYEAAGSHPRKEIEAEPPRRTERTGEDVLEERLADLGYV